MDVLAVYNDRYATTSPEWPGSGIRRQHGLTSSAAGGVIVPALTSISLMIDLCLAQSTHAYTLGDSGPAMGEGQADPPYLRMMVSGSRRSNSFFTT